MTIIHVPFTRKGALSEENQRAIFFVSIETHYIVICSTVFQNLCIKFPFRS
uniref:Uncharacterized protein n=1 Tax=Lepeophtheirus salmonis TaxID=72036 RepID=A0A0K2U8H2_LEPSM